MRRSPPGTSRSWQARRARFLLLDFLQGNGLVPATGRTADQLAGEGPRCRADHAHDPVPPSPADPRRQGPRGREGALEVLEPRAAGQGGRLRPLAPLGPLRSATPCISSTCPPLPTRSAKQPLGWVRFRPTANGGELELHATGGDRSQDGERVELDLAGAEQPPEPADA